MDTMLKFNESDLKALNCALQSCRKAAILTHTHPDGDALGSTIALKHFLMDVLKKDAVIITPTVAPSTLSFLSDGEGILVTENTPGTVREMIAESDLIFGLDISGLERTDDAAKWVEESGATKILIDHHLAPRTDQFSLVFSMTNVSSTCELLYFLLKKLPSGLAAIPMESLEAIMVGMTTDSNNFANSVFPTTLEMASELLEAGVDRDAIIDNLYKNDREERVRAFSWLLSNKLTLTPAGVAFIVIDADTYAELGIIEGETEGLVNIPLGIGRVKISVLAKASDGLFRISIRSKRGVSANRLAREYFNGGGHEQAAGGKFDPAANSFSIEEYIETATAQFLQENQSK